MLYNVVKNLNHKIQSAFDPFSSLPLISDLVKILKKLILSNFFFVSDIWVSSQRQ